MSKPIHPAHRLRRAEIAFDVAGRQAAQLDEQRRPWGKLSPRRFATLAGTHALLEEAARLCEEAGADARSPLATAIRDLHTKTERQLRSILVLRGVTIMLAALLLGALVYLAIGVIPRDDSPVITGPKVGDTVEMAISVSGSSPRGSLPPGINLYVLVKPQGLDYWVQLPPELNRTGWRAAEIGVGQPHDVGMYFRVCAILTDQTLSAGWHAPDLPPGDSHCIDVIRK